MVQDRIASLQGWIHQEYLPVYAPELNPVEYIWGHGKQHKLPNICPEDYWQLEHFRNYCRPLCSDQTMPVRCLG
jgi:transposase